jgi:thymidylate synthase
MIARATGYEPGEFIHTLGDAHIYLNHIDQVKLQLTRKPYNLPEMKLNPDITDITKFRFEDFALNNYIAHPQIKGDISV